VRTGRVLEHASRKLPLDALRTSVTERDADQQVAKDLPVGQDRAHPNHKQRPRDCQSTHLGWRW